MLEQAGIYSLFVSGTPARIEPPRADRWRTAPVLDRRGSSLAKQLLELCRDSDIAAVILHVSGYGYAKRGAPIWLMDGMRIWRKRHNNCRLLGIFHELFATGDVWSSSFWLSTAQKHVTRGIWKLCDGGLVTTAVCFDQLAAWRPDMERSLRRMPVVSNVGEPSFMAPVEERPLNMAVFGHPGVENSVYIGPRYKQCASIAETLGILKIIDIGARTITPPCLGQIPVTPFGQLSPDDVSQRLMSCRFGLLDYNPRYLEKSGVFAAYAAHGVIPVCIGSEGNPPHGLEEGRHFLRWPLKALPDLHAMQINLTRWYDGHSLAKHAALIASWCRPDKSMQAMQARLSRA